MKDIDLWPLIWEASTALTAKYGPATDRAAEGLGIPRGEWYGWLMAARLFEPAPVSVQRLQIRSAYTAPARLEAALATGVRLGLLEPIGEGEHRMTEAGRTGVRRVIESAYAAMVPLRPMPDVDLERLATLLRRVVEASLAAPEPPGKWCLENARHFDPGPGAAVMERLDQYLSDLKAYRDDATLAAWQPHGVSGQVWEAFSQLSRGAVRTLDELCEKLSRRGFRREDYSSALQDLIGRGWVTQDQGTYMVTGRGRVLWEETEATTDRYFYRPWECLSGAEIDEVRELLARFRDGLNPPKG